MSQLKDVLKLAGCVGSDYVGMHHYECWNDLDKLGWWFQHGENPEHRRFFPLFPDQVLVLYEWLNEIHAREIDECNAQSATP